MPTENTYVVENLFDEEDDSLVEEDLFSSESEDLKNDNSLVVGDLFKEPKHAAVYGKKKKVDEQVVPDLFGEPLPDEFEELIPAGPLSQDEAVQWKAGFGKIPWGYDIANFIKEGAGDQIENLVLSDIFEQLEKPEKGFWEKDVSPEEFVDRLASGPHVDPSVAVTMFGEQLHAGAEKLRKTDFSEGPFGSAVKLFDKALAVNDFVLQLFRKGTVLGMKSVAPDFMGIVEKVSGEQQEQSYNEWKQAKGLLRKTPKFLSMSFRSLINSAMSTEEFEKAFDHLTGVEDRVTENGVPYIQNVAAEILDFADPDVWIKATIAISSVGKLAGGFLKLGEKALLSKTSGKIQMGAPKVVSKSIQKAKEIFLLRPMGKEGKAYYNSYKKMLIDKGHSDIEGSLIAEKILAMTKGRKDIEHAAFCSFLGRVPGVRMNSVRNPDALALAKKRLAAAGERLNLAKRISPKMRTELSASLDDYYKAAYDFTQAEVPFTMAGITDISKGPIQTLKQHRVMLGRQAEDAERIAYYQLKNNTLKNMEKAVKQRDGYLKIQNIVNDKTSTGKKIKGLGDKYVASRMKIDPDFIGDNARKIINRTKGKIKTSTGKKLKGLNKEISKYKRQNEVWLRSKASGLASKGVVRIKESQQVVDQNIEFLSRIAKNPKDYSEAIEAGKLARVHQKRLSEILKESNLPSNRMMDLINETEEVYVRQLYLNNHPLFLTTGVGTKKGRLSAPFLKKRKYDIFDPADYLSMQDRGLVEYASANIFITNRQISHAVATSEHFSRVVKNPKFVLNNDMVKKAFLDKGDDAINYLERMGYKQLPPAGESFSVSRGLFKKKYVSGKTALGDLGGKWVHHSIHADLMDSAFMESKLATLYYNSMRLFKAGKVVYNPQAHVRNLITNTMLLDFAGINHFQQLKIMPSTVEGMLNKDAYYEEALANMSSLHGGSALTQEFAFKVVKGHKAEEIIRYIERDGHKAMSDILGNIFKTPMRLYEFEEHLFKHMAFRHARIHMGMNPKTAGAFAEKYIFDYSDVPRYITALKNTVIPFITFSYKAMPVLAETAKTRPLVIYKYYALINSLNNAAALSNGLTKDQLKELQRKMPKYMQPMLGVMPQYVMAPSKDKFGRFGFTNTSYYYPIGMLPEIGMDWKNAINSPYVSFVTMIKSQKDWIGRDLVGIEDKHADGTLTAKGNLKLIGKAASVFLPTILSNDIAKLAKDYGWFGYPEGGKYHKPPHKGGNIYKEIPGLRNIKAFESPTIMDIAFGVKVNFIDPKMLKATYKWKIERIHTGYMTRLKEIATERATGAINIETYLNKRRQAMTALSRSLSEALDREVRLDIGRKISEDANKK